jgi:hypothetical protein
MGGTSCLPAGTTATCTVRDLRTGADRALTQRDDFNIGISAISPDAASVAYQAYGRRLRWKAGGPSRPLHSLPNRKGTSHSKAILESDEILDIAPMAWSPDGRSIAVSLRRRDRTAQIGLVTLADGSLRVLQTVDWRGPTRIFFFSQVVRSRVRFLAVCAIDSDKPRHQDAGSGRKPRAWRA